MRIPEDKMHALLKYTGSMSQAEFSKWCFKIMARREHYWEGAYGGAICSECGGDVSKHYKECPKCGVKFNEKGDYSYNPGGSDF